MSGSLVELAQRFVRLSGELNATRDTMKPLLLNGTGSNDNPTPAQRASAKGPQPSHPKALRGLQVEETIVRLLRSGGRF